MRKKNCLCGRSMTKSQSTPVVTTSLLSPLKVWCRNGVVRLCKVAYRSTRSRRGNHGQSICVAWRWAVLPRFNEHWRLWHSSDLRQRRTARGTTFVSSGVRWRHFRVVPSLFYQLFTVFVPHTDHSFLVTHSTMTRKTTALYQSVFEKVHVKYTNRLSKHPFSRVFLARVFSPPPTITPLYTALKYSYYIRHEGCFTRRLSLCLFVCLSVCFFMN